MPVSVSPYGSPLPYGGWALSFAILLGGFFVAAGWSETADTGRDNTKSAASGACHTDQEADRAQWQSASPRNQTSLSDAVLREEGMRAPPGGEEKGGRRRRRAGLAAAGTSSPSSAFPFASAAMDAASAARKSDVGTAAERRRLEREALRVSVHVHIRKELVKKSIEDTRALAAMADHE